MDKKEDYVKKINVCDVKSCFCFIIAKHTHTHIYILWELI